MLAGPVVWAMLLETNYVLSYVACEHKHTWMLHLATAAALALVALAGFGAWRAAPPLGSDEIPSTNPMETGLLRARFMAMGGLALCAFFILVIAATEVPVFLLHPCSW